MDVFLAILTFLKSALWPAVAVWLVWYLKDNIKDLFLKHKDTEFRITLKEVGAKKAEIDKLIKDVNEKLTLQHSAPDVDNIKSSLSRIPELTAEIAALKEDLIGSLSSVAESGSNSDGGYELYNNGLLRQTLLIKAGQIRGKTEITFPQMLSDSSASVTFVGKEQPAITHLSKGGMVLELPEPNSEDIQVTVFGFKNF